MQAVSPGAGTSRTSLGAKPVIKIHPAIGIARLGDANEYFIGPEIPGQGATGEDKAASVGSPVPPQAGGSYRQPPATGKIKRQAARFHLFLYTPGKEPEELNSDHADVASIEWTVHLANRKAAFYAFSGQTGASGPYTGALAPPGSGPDPAAVPPWRNAGVSGPDREKLVIDPGPRTIRAFQSGGGLAAGSGPIQFAVGVSPSPAYSKVNWPNYIAPHPNAGSPVIDYLGEIWTDNKGRLLVLGAHGKSARRNPAPPPPAADIVNYANNDDWFDDVSDGPVTAKIKIKSSGKTVTATAWVCVGPPDFAPPIGNVVTLYNTVMDVAVNNASIPIPKDVTYTRRPLLALREMRDHAAAYKPEWETEIKPFFARAGLNVWVHGPLQGHHGTFSMSGLDNPDPANNAARQFLFNYLRPPGGNTSYTAPPNMPKLFGDGYDDNGSNTMVLAINKTQYLLLQKWSTGNFSTGSPAASTITPDGLDQAALENCVGGAFFPGIEVSWLVRQPGIYLEPFRIKHGAKVGKLTVGPGFFSQQMALPWQADFFDCAKDNDSRIGTFYGWWPAQRPDDVFKSAGDVTTGTMTAWADGIAGMREMVDKWNTRGFVVQEGGNYIAKDAIP